MNNEVTLQGLLTEEVELKTSANGNKYAHGKIAIIQQRGEEVKTNYHSFVTFGEAAEQLAGFEKGAPIQVKGQICRSDYGEENTKKTKFDIVGRAVTVPENDGYQNYIKLAGFVQGGNKEGRLELKTSEKGTEWTTVAISVKRDEAPAKEGTEPSPAKYDTIFATAFGTQAQKITSEYSKGDLVELHGTISFDKKGSVSPLITRSKLIRSASDIQEAQAEGKNNQNQKQPKEKTQGANVK